MVETTTEIGMREIVDGIMEKTWQQLEWHAVARARALAFACRLDRQLEEVSAVAERPESRLAARLRTELQAAVERAMDEGHPPGADALFAAAEAVHEQLAYLPKPAMPAGVRVFLRGLFDRRWDENVVVAAVSRPRWPLARAGRGGTDPDRPVTVLPRADMRNPLMWPLIALQGADIVGWTDAEERVRQALGPGVRFAVAEAMLSDGERSAAARELWQRGCEELSAAGPLYDDALELARSLADGILISARRVGARGGDNLQASSVLGGAGVGGASGGTADIYRQLEAVRDVPAEAVEILSAGWIHWYGHAAPRLLAADDWAQKREIVDGVDDVLCRSLDVAAIHRFYTTEGAST